ncbi:hypothetical protein THII_1117 [Thioploca ingrica]|uniref:Uncharacterized protein n=1 Tax=Thioploca ingrica TaxID=40754 RepID=A0A090AEN7_9GAMM|nr:hypothetical protein THII_1117 [Thioploca ingrica]
MVIKYDSSEIPLLFFTLFTNKPVKLESNPMDENNPANIVKPIMPIDITLIGDIFVIPDG